MRLILTLPGNRRFGRALARAGGWPLGRVERRRFPDGESGVRLDADVRGRAVDIVCTLARPDRAFLPLMFAADAARDLGATEVGLVAPYLAYLRQDRRFRPGEAISSRTFARLLASGFDRLLTVDPHLHRYASLSEIYPVPTTVLTAAPAQAAWIAARTSRPLVVGPDAESAAWAAAVAAPLGAPWVTLTKVRRGDRAVEITAPDLSAWRDRQPVLVDDVAASGATLATASRRLVGQGLARPLCVVTHAIFAGDALARVQAVSEAVVSTDSVPHASNAIPLAGLVAAALEPPPCPA